MTQEGIHRTVLNSLKEFIIWMVELNKYENDRGSRQMKIQSFGDLQMEGVMVEGEVSHVLVGSIRVFIFIIKFIGVTLVNTII